MTLNIKYLVRRLLTTILMLLICWQSFAQSPFKDASSADNWIIGGGIALEVLMRLAIKEKDHSTINRDTSTMMAFGFEKRVYRNNSIKAHHFSDKILGGTGIIAASSQFLYKDFKRAGYITLQTLLVNDVLNLAAKNLIKRKRPFVYNTRLDKDKEGCDTYNHLDGNAIKSFYSGHTANVTTFSFLSASLFSHYHPESKLRQPIWLTAGILSSLTGYLRVRAGKHFPTDVLTGYLIGGALGYFIPRWHRIDNFGADDQKYWQEFAIGAGTGVALGMVLAIINPSIKPACEFKTANKGKAKFQASIGPTGFVLGLHF